MEDGQQTRSMGASSNDKTVGFEPTDVGLIPAVLTNKSG